MTQVVPALLVGRPTHAVSNSSAVLTRLFAVAKQCSISVSSALYHVTQQQAAHHTCSLFCGFGLRELATALDGGGWSAPRPGRFTPGNDLAPIV